MSTLAARSSSNLVARNSARWAAMSVTTSRVPILDGIARRLVAPDAKTRYQQVENATRVPWFIIAVIHEREASQSWGANIAQGDPWNRVSVHVPRGRGPFPSWYAAAVDALTKCAPYAASNHDWSAGGALTLLEKYNGLGYANMGLPSPYIWSLTNQYLRGKYTSDGHYDPSVVDPQPGCAALIKRMMALDPSIRFAGDDGVGNIESVGSTESLSKGQIEALQQQLTDKGYPLGAIDGIFGTLTTQALLAFQRDHGLPTTGVPDMTTLMMLALAPDRRLDPKRSTVTIDDVRQLGSKIIASAGNTKLIGYVSAILGALGLGNSALLPIANGYAGGGASGNMETSRAALMNALRQLQPLLANNGPNANVATEQLQPIHQLLTANLQLLSPDLLQRLKEVADRLPNNGRVDELHNLLSQVKTMQPQLNTIFDIFPQQVFTDGVMHLLTTGLSVAANTFLPGIGGSLAALGIGLATNYFSSQVMNVRVQDHRTAKHVGL